MINFIYLVAVLVWTSGLFMMLTSDNYFSKIIGLGVFQSAVLIFFIALGKVAGGTVPIERCAAIIDIATASPQNCEHIYSSPLPQVLMLTAIVVGFATLSVGLSLIRRMYKQFGTIAESEIDSRKINDEHI